MDVSASHGRLSTAGKDFIARRHKLLIDGQWVDASSGKTFAVFDPSNGQQIAQVAEGTAADVDEAVKAARRAFEDGPWARMKPTERGKLVWKLGDVLEAHADELAELEALDNGKPIRDARAVDIPFGCELLRYMGGWSTKITGQSIPISAPGDWHAYSIREPVGVVGQVIPWNFPLLMAVWKIAPALAAGCTIVLKPAEQTPLSAIRLGELAQEAGLPPGVLNIVTGDGSAGAAIAAHPDVDKVAFTGSTEVGKLIVQAAAGNLKKVSLELGAAKLKIGPGLDPESRIGPLVSDEQFRRVTGYLDSGRQQGAEVVTGGKRHGNEGYFVEPTVLAKTTPEMKVVQEEIFGPVVCAMPYNDDDLDRIAKQGNATEYGLAASIWTRDIGIAHKLARKLKAGSVWINVHNFNDVALPFGGYKQSGWGREMGYEAIELYTETKAVAALL